MPESVYRRLDGQAMARTAGVIVAGTAVLTASFVGVLAVVSGSAGGVSSRLPVYFFAGAVGFVGSLLVLEQSRHGGQTALAGAVMAGIAGFCIVGLSAEGLVYVVRHPEIVVGSQMLLYLAAAALVAAGIGHWSVRNWRTIRRLASSRSTPGRRVR